MSQYVHYPVMGVGVVEFTNFAAFPSNPSNGFFAFDLSTGTLYVYSNGSWVIIGGGGSTITGIGTFDSGTPSANGAHVDSDLLIMQSASATVPGLVNIGTQTLAGAKTFTGAASFTASTAVPLIATASRNGGYSIEAVNSNTGSSAAASFVSGTNAGTFEAGGNSTAGGANAYVNWNGTGGMDINAQGGTLRLKAANTLAATFTGANGVFAGTISASNLSGTNTGDVTIGTANGLSLVGQVLSLGLSSTSTTGALSSTDWNTFNGKQATVTIGAYSNTSTANGLDITSNVLTLHSADGTNPGAVSTTSQTFAGAKTFSATTTHNALLTVSAALSTLFTARNTGAATAQSITGNTAGDFTIRALASGDALLYSDTAKYLAFGSNGSNERVRINSSGNVSINNTSDTFKLDVTGTFNASAATTLGDTLGVTSTVTLSSLSGTGSRVVQANATGVLSAAVATDTANTVSTIVLRDGSGNFAAGTITASLSGNATTATSATTATTATNATNVATTATNTTNASFFPTFVASSSSGNQGIDTATGLSFNPSTNTLTTTTFSGALSGNATTATTATNANNVATTSVSTNASFFPLFVASSSNSNQAVDLGTGLTFNPSTNNLSTTTFTGALSGNATTATSATTATTATNANNVATTSVSTNASFFPLFVSSSSNSNQAVDLGTGLTFNPSTNNLSTTTFTGALSGNATTATTATNATNVATTATNSTNASFFPTFVSSSSSSNQGIDTATGLTFNPSTNTLTTTTFSGALSGNATTATTATNATNTAITDDTTTNATMYPTWVTTASGNQAQKVSSTKLSFNPSTGALTSTSFAGNISGGTIAGTTGTFTGTVAVTSTSASGLTFKHAADDNTQIVIGNNTGTSEVDLTFRLQAGGNALIFSDTGKNLALGSNGSNARMTVLSSGNVGIGNTNDAQKFEVTGNMATSGAFITSSYDTASPTNGQTVTASANKPGVLITPAGTIATATIKLPSSPIDGQQYWVASGQIITAVTWQDSGGTAGNVIGGPSTIGGTGSGVTFVYSSGNTKWYNIG